MKENFGDKINTAGLDKHPENINRKGQPVSIKNQLKEILLKDGELPIPKEQFLKMAEKDGKEFYIFKISTQTAMALKLQSMAMGNNSNAFQAIKLIQEMFDGRAFQSLGITNPDGSLTQSTGLEGKTFEELYQLKYGKKPE